MKKIFLLVAILTLGSASAQTGAMDYWTNSFTKVKLPIGSSGKVLTVVGGLPSWQTGASTLTFNAPLVNTTNTVSLTYGTGLSVSSGSLVPDVTLTNTVTLTNKTITPLATNTLAITATTTVNGQNNIITNISASSTLTAVSVTYTSIPDGGTVYIDYQKTTSSNSVWTFVSGSIVSAASDASISGSNLIATLISTSSGRYIISIQRLGSLYLVTIINVIP